MTIQTFCSGVMGTATVMGETAQGGPSVARVRGPTGQIVVLQSVDELARRADSDAEVDGDVLDAAGAIAAVKDPERSQARQGQPEVSLQPGVDDIPELGLVANQGIEEGDMLLGHRHSILQNYIPGNITLFQKAEMFCHPVVLVGALVWWALRLSDLVVM